MEVYSTEHEQIESLKRWWDKNGRLVSIAVVLLLAGVFSGRMWLDYRHQRAAEASAAYQQMMDVLANEPEKAMEIGRSIVSTYPSTTYAAMASLGMGRIAVEQKDLDAAAAHLGWAMNHAEEAGLRHAATARLARVMLSKGDGDKALALLDMNQVGSFQAVYQEIRGDIFLSQGKPEEARAAYTNALAGYTEPSKLEIVKMKLQDLAEIKDKGEGK